MGKKIRHNRSHFRKRFRERVGVDIRRKHIEKIVRMIQNNLLEFAERKTRRRTAFYLKTPTKKYVIIYSNMTHLPVTILL